MTDWQKAVVAFFLFSVFMACVFPPWGVVKESTYGHLGYAPLWAPPHDEFSAVMVDLNYRRFAAELVVITLVFGALFLLNARKNGLTDNPTSSPPPRRTDTGTQPPDAA